MSFQAYRLLQTFIAKGLTVKRQLVTAAAIVLLLGGAATLRAQDKFQESPYYPVKVGDTWTYKIAGQDQKIQIKISKHEKVGDVTCAVLEVSVGGNVVATEYVSPQADGVYRLKGMNQDVTPPLRFLKLPPKKGDTWKIDSKVGPLQVKGDCSTEEGDVTVPAGKYKAMVVKNDLELGGMKVTTTYYFAKDVGMVKQIADINGVNIVLELEKFESGK